MYVTKSLLASRKSTGNKSLHCTCDVDGYTRELGGGFPFRNQNGKVAYNRREQYRLGVTA